MEMMNNDDDDDDDEANWLDLPFDLFFEIINNKVISSSFEDQMRLGCVCVQWRSFFSENYEQIRLSNLPVLLIPSLNHHHHPNYDNNEVEPTENNWIIYNYYNPKEVWLGLDHTRRYTSTRSFYSLSEKKVYDFQLQVPSNLHCCGSHLGWLLLVEERLDGTLPVHLFNPFRSSDRKTKIQLPPLTSDLATFGQFTDSYLLKKFVFSRDPLSSSSLLGVLSNPTSTEIDDGDFVVLVSDNNCEFIFWRPGDSAWTPLEIPNRPIYDFICYKGQFWGILQNGTALAFEDITPEPKVTLVVDPHPKNSCSTMGRYLVESAGDLFNVEREHCYPDDNVYSTVGFHVFKLDQTAMKWVKTNTLDGRIFFLGDNASVSLSPSDYFLDSCKPNSIYFTDDCAVSHRCRPWVFPHDMGVFNVEDNSLEPHYKMESKTIMPAPIWIQPML